MSAPRGIWPSLIVPSDEQAAQRAGRFLKSIGGDAADLVQIGASKETIDGALRSMNDALRKVDGETGQAQAIFLATCGEDAGALRRLEDVVDVAAEAFPWPLRRHHVLCPAPGRPVSPQDVPFVAAGAWFVGPPSGEKAQALDSSVKEPLHALLTLLCLTDWRDRLHDAAVREFFVPRLPFPEEPLVRFVGVPHPSPFGARGELCVALVGEAVRRAVACDEADEIADRAAEQILADPGRRKKLADELPARVAAQPLDVALRLCTSILTKLGERSATAERDVEAHDGPPAPDGDEKMSLAQRMAAWLARRRGLICYLPRRDAPRRPAPPALASEQQKALEARGPLFATLSAKVDARTRLPGAPPEVLDAATRRTQEALAQTMSRSPSADPAVDAEAVLGAATREIADDAGLCLWNAGAEWGDAIESCAAVVAALETWKFEPFGRRSVAPRLAASTAGFGGSIPGADGRLPLAEVSACRGGGDAFLVVSGFVPARTSLG